MYEVQARIALTLKQGVVGMEKAIADLDVRKAEAKEALKTLALNMDKLMLNKQLLELQQTHKEMGIEGAGDALLTADLTTVDVDGVLRSISFHEGVGSTATTTTLELNDYLASLKD